MSSHYKIANKFHSKTYNPRNNDWGLIYTHTEVVKWTYMYSFGNQGEASIFNKKISFKFALAINCINKDFFKIKNFYVQRYKKNKKKASIICKRTATIFITI